MESVKTLNMKKSQNYGINMRSIFTQKQKSHDNSRIEKGLTTTPPEYGAYDHVSYANMIYVMMCNHMI